MLVTVGDWPAEVASERNAVGQQTAGWLKRPEERPAARRAARQRRVD
jgi:hypothetical protein